MTGRIARNSCRRQGCRFAAPAMAAAVCLLTANALALRPVPDAPQAKSAEAQTRLNRIVELTESSRAMQLIGRERWSELLAQHRPAIERATSHRQFAETVNKLFAACEISHFSYFPDYGWLYWHLGAAFKSDERDMTVAHIGLLPQQIGESWFVRAILLGSPAEGLDIQVGDELVDVDGEPFGPIRPFVGKHGVPVRLKVGREANATHIVTVVPVKESLHGAFQRSVEQSVRILDHNGYRFAYLHGLTLLGDASEYWALLDLQDEVDGLLLDYRDGIGGFAGRGRGFLFGPLGEHRHWEKPTVILIADGTRSAKESLVHEAQRRDRAALVGTPTPGHVTSIGGVHQIGTDALLMLPGHRTELEGHSTKPDYLIDRDIRYCNGADPQFERAKEVLVERIRASRRAE